MRRDAMSGLADLQIRLARPEERDALEALQWRASLANESDRPHLEGHPDAIHLPVDQIVRGQVFIAELGGRAVGFSAIVAEEGHLELDGLFVEPDMWRRGVGAALVEVAVHEAAETRFGPALRMSR